MSAGEANTAVEVAAGHVTGLRERLARIEQLAHTRAMRGAAPVPASSLLPVDAAARPRVHPLVDAAPQPSPLIVKSNRLIEASYQLTLAEQRVLLCVVAQIDRYPGAAPVTADTPFEVTARGLAELFGLPKKQAYALMVHGGEKFAERWVIIDAPDPAQPRLTQTKTRWVHKIDYLPAAGTLRLYLAPAVISYLTHLASEFTHYHLISVARMTTPYALRLYELLLQWLKRGERDLSLAWLKHHFDLSHEYSRVGNLKARVIIPAVAQINEHSNLSVSWRQTKQGRTVVGFTFYFKLKEEGVPRRRGSLSRADIIAQAMCGETWEQAHARLSRAAR